MSIVLLFCSYRNLLFYIWFNRINIQLNTWGILVSKKVGLVMVLMFKQHDEWHCELQQSQVRRGSHPFLTILAGSVTLTNVDGSSESFTAGDTFFIAKGTQCIWEITETLRKYYCDIWIT